MRDLAAVRDWIAAEDERAARRVISRIRQTVEMFASFPQLGHAGDIAGTREFKVTGMPCLIVYRIVSDEDLDVFTIIHAKRRYP